jgi:hypothetical protein
MVIKFCSWVKVHGGREYIMRRKGAGLTVIPVEPLLQTLRGI